MPGCGCGKGSGDAKSGPFLVQAPGDGSGNGVITSWRTEAEQQQAAERTGGRAL